MVSDIWSVAWNKIGLIDAKLWEVFCSSYTYATAFVNNRLTESSLPELTKEYLKDLGITIIGDIITILKHITTHLQDMNLSTSTNNATITQPRETVVKTNIPPPQLHADMTSNR